MMIHDLEDELQYLYQLLAEIIIYCGLNIDNLNDYSLEELVTSLESSREDENNLHNPKYLNSVNNIYLSYHILKKIYEG